MPEELVIIYTAAGQVEANLIKSMLEAENIPVMVVQEGAGAAYGLTVGVLGQAILLVPVQYRAAAEAAVNEFQQGRSDADEAQEIE